MLYPFLLIIKFSKAQWLSKRTLSEGILVELCPGMEERAAHGHVSYHVRLVPG